MSNSPTVAVCGGGIGGLTAAIALRRMGIDVTVFERSAQFSRVGADINLTPNAVHALDGLGGDLPTAIRARAARPRYRISRTWDTGEETSRLEMGDTAERTHGAPQLTLHRGDLMTALESAVPEGDVRMGKSVVGIDVGNGGGAGDRSATIRFADGGTHRSDIVIGADGIHSAVRTAMFGMENPTFTGVVAFRAVVSADRVPHLPNRDSFTKWWGPDPATQIVTFPLNRGEEIFIFATCAQEEWTEESWTTPGSIVELQELYRGFHPEARALLAVCDSVLKSALYVRDPLESWTDGVAVLLGDACHPMMPFMAQGAGQAIEDAVVLSRCLSEIDDAATALGTFARMRRERTSEIQRASRHNEWLKAGGNADWLYQYDAWREPLAHQLREAVAGRDPVQMGVGSAVS